MSELKNIPIADYDYPLPEERIAKFPMEQRDHSKLLCLNGNGISEHHFYDLPDLLPKDTLLVFNDTK
ncbi:MAG: S-adenosylmethionine:tRNA ribosyltransferase-isomerase, partial [Bacteroidales bacterium]|nr:S-adenosylmethionine:tRNA ribosyltransferase-isomerase [Bacteroidales bacterium]